MSDRASSNNPHKNVVNINLSDGDPNSDVLEKGSLKSLAECKTTGPHYQGTDGEGPLMCDYPDTDKDSPTSSPESPQKNYSDREGEAHKKKGPRAFYNGDDSVISDELDGNDINGNLPGRTEPEQSRLKENRPVGGVNFPPDIETPSSSEMAGLVDEDIEEQVNSLLDQKTPENGDWEPTEECMQRSLNMASKRLRAWKRSRKIQKRT